MAAAVAAAPASAHPSGDPLHGGSGEGVTVLGHTDLGNSGLNSEVAVLGNYAFVGSGTNGGFAAQWNKAPKCDATTNTVKVVNLTDPANPRVVSTIPLPGTTLPRAVAAIRVKPLGPRNTFTGDLLAVALESCRAALDGQVGVRFYDVSNPAAPEALGSDDRFLGNTATRDVSLAQRPDGQVLAFEANQGGNFGAAAGGGGGIHIVDATNPAAPVPIGRYNTGNFSSNGPGCRPYGYANGVAVDPTGTRAYAAYQDQGVLTLDASNPALGVPVRGRAVYPPTEEGNSFRFVPNATETTALATDEDPLPARTTLTIGAGPAAGSYAGCEAIWGGPLFRQAVPSLDDRKIVVVPNNGCNVADYAGVTPGAGDLVLADRGGSGTCPGFGFDDKAKLAQAAGAAALLVANSVGGPFLSPDAAGTGDAGVRIPVVLLSNPASVTIKTAVAGGRTVATLADTADTWGALRIFDLAGPNPVQTSVFNAPRTNVLTPGDGLYHATDAVWDGDQALVAWMSDGLRVVDVADRSAPKAGPFYIPPAVPDPTGNYPTVPLVVSAASFGPKRVVISDVNGGLYVVSLEAPGGPPAAPTSPTDVAAVPGPATAGGAAPGASTTPGPRAFRAPQTVTAISALAAQTRRARALSSCLAAVKRHLTREQGLARRGSARKRSLARRHLKRHARTGRRRCLQIHGRTPGRVTGLRGRASATKLTLSFKAVGTDGSRPPAARAYVVRQSTRPIRTARDFRRARLLCKGSCRFPGIRVGERNALTVTDLKRRTTYYYAVRARDNVSGRLGPRSVSVRVRTR